MKRVKIKCVLAVWTGAHNDFFAVAIDTNDFYVGYLCSESAATVAVLCVCKSYDGAVEEARRAFVEAKQASAGEVLGTAAADLLLSKKWVIQ